MAAPAIAATDIARDNPDFARRNPGLANRQIAAEPAAKKTVVRRRRSPERIRIERANARVAEARAARAEAPPQTKAGPNLAPKYGPSAGVRTAANATSRAAGRIGRAQRTTRRGFGGGGTIGGIIVFATGVGVFLWLVRNPTVLPKLIAFVTTIIKDVLTLGVH